MISIFKEYAGDFFSLFYPNVCLACSQKLLKEESIICFRCEQELPETNQYNTADNKLIRRFWGRVNIEGAAALYHFQKGSNVQHLLHQLKYAGRKEVGVYMGQILGQKLMEENSLIKKVDLIVPVPLHWKKLKKRGYNQCDPFAEGLSKAMGIPWSSTALQRVHENISQTKKNRFDRYENVAEIFSVSDEAQLLNKHILVVDDVVTTGATAEACMQAIVKIPGTRVSFVAIATATR